MNINLNRDACARVSNNVSNKMNICDVVRGREAAAYYGDAPVDLYGYSHLSNAADADGSDLLVLMHPAQHMDDGNLMRVVPQEVPKPVVPPQTHTAATSSVYTPAQAPSSSAVANLRAAIEGVLGSTPVVAEEVERVKEARFAANGVKKFRGVTRHKRTLRFEAHIWESKKQIYLGGFESELLAARSHDIMALKCKGLDWGALNFDKGDYATVIELLHLVQKEDIIYCLREFSKVFGELGSDVSGGGSLQSQATHISSQPNQLVHVHPKGGHTLKPSLKIRKHTDHGSHGSHGHHHGHHLPGTPRTPFNSSGRAPITPKDKVLSEVAMAMEIPSDATASVLGSLETFVDAMGNGAGDIDTTALNIGNIGNMGDTKHDENGLENKKDMEDMEDLVNVSLFNPEQPVDAFCEQGVFLPDTNGPHDIKEDVDPFSMLYDSFESSATPSGCEGSEPCNDGLGLGGTSCDDVFENAWQWSHC